MENMSIERLIMQSANITTQIALVKQSIEEYNKSLVNGKYRVNTDLIELKLCQIEQEVLTKFTQYIETLHND